MGLKSVIKQALPQWLLIMYRRLWKYLHRWRLLASIPPSARKLYKLTTLTSHDVKLSLSENSTLECVMTAATSIYGDQWNYYSDALRPEIVRGFSLSIEALRADFTSVNYLEIGSCQGLSMALIALLLRDRGMLGSLVSVDPYFEHGYVEGRHGPYQVDKQINIDSHTMQQAQALYSALSLSVEQLRFPSLVGLTLLIQSKRLFELIYIDGSHEELWPITDFGISRSLLADGGVLILDDYLWPDVLPIKQLCDKYGVKVQETWKTASYKFN